MKIRKRITVFVLLATVAALSAAAGPVCAADAGARYLDALRAFKTLSADKKAGELREKWLALDADFVAVYRADPDGPAAPKALFYRGWVYEELARRSYLKKDYADAAELYLRMVERFPGHDWADDALFRRAEILLQRLGDKRAAKSDLERALSDYPSGDKALACRELLASFDPGNPLLRHAAAEEARPEPAKVQAAVQTPAQPSVQTPGQIPAQTPEPARPQAQISPQPEPQAQVQAVFPAPQVPAAKPATPDNPATLQAVETSVENGQVRVALVLDRETTYRYQLLGKEKKGDGLQRLYIDLDNTAIGGKVPRDMKTPDNVIRRIRAAYNRPGVVRVVLDMEDHAKHAVFSLDSPFRVVLDLQGTRPVKTAVAAASPQKAAGEAQQAAKEPDVFSNWVKNLFDTDAKEPKTADAAQAGKPATPEKTVAMQAPPVKAAPAAKPDEYKPPPGSKQRLGDLIEQLGLTVKNIMVDPGHGGKDPGAQGRYGIVEKDLNLRFAKILGKKLSEHGFNVSYTRTKDVFVSLEKRTEMANEKSTDLFISVHCNAHGSEDSNGLETYSLNLARTEDAVRVAARENAVSAKQISDLQLILTDLMLNSKMKESKELAKTVQDKAIRNVKRYGAKDRGPHEAPFYVLMGAKMPAILVELGYITNKKEAKRLNSDAYLDTLAQGLVNGVIAYKKQIERFASIAKPRA